MQKEAAAREHMAQKQAALAGNLVSPAYTSNGINLVQQAQQTTYWCGPATLSELLNWKNHTTPQSTAASLSKTTTDGTAWSGVNANSPSPTGYPVPDVLNYRIGYGFYVPYSLPYTPTSSDMSRYETSLVSDIDNLWGLAGDAWEVAGGPHLTGHPKNLTIYHWYAITGYDSGGAGTDYADSVYGSSTSWASGVPRYTYGFTSSVITTINGGRGYVW